MVKSATAAMAVGGGDAHVTIDTYVEDEGHTLDVNEVMADHSATLGQLFTVCRQWTPRVQARIDDIMHEFLCRGASPNDRDALTGDTLLHFACKAGAVGLGCEREAAQAVQRLLDAGASPNAQSKWTGMTPLHTAAFFGFEKGLELMLKGVRRANCNVKASGYDQASPLHLAVQSMHPGCVALLLQHGASRTQQDEHGKTPYDYALETQRTAKGEDRELLTTICRTLREHVDPTAPTAPTAATARRPSTGRGRSGVAAVGAASSSTSASVATIEIGDRVAISGQRKGTVRYRGLVDFKPGRWLGIELDDAKGKHDGTVQGKTYFTCKDKHGVFVHADAATLLAKSGKKATKSAGATKTPRKAGKGGERSRPLRSPSASPARRGVNTSFSSTQRSPRARATAASAARSGRKVDIGSRVMVHGKHAHVRFIGTTEFAEGMWLGLELDDASGKNDGTVHGKRYFTARPDHGLFVRPSRATLHGITVDKLLQ